MSSTNLEGDMWRWYHNVSECHYHIQLTVKYRKSLLDEEVQEIIKERLSNFKERFAIDVYKLGFDRNHVHILCQFLPKYAGGEVIRLIKSLTAKRILKLERIRQELWGGEFWTDGYFIGTVSCKGDKKTIERYIEKQGQNLKDVQLRLFDFDALCSDCSENREN